MKNNSRWTGTLLAAFALSTAAFAQTSAPVTGSPVSGTMSGSVPSSGASASYQIGPGDLLNIMVYRAPDMQTAVRVTAGGAIVVPQIGEMRVEGLTAQQVSERIANELKARGILISPVVNVLVSEVRSKLVTVMGSVGRPGEIPLDRPGMTLAEVLARAGATFGTGAGIVTSMASGDNSAQRQQMRIADIVSGSADRPARAGEVLVVQAAPTIYVSGEVGRPGAYPLEPGMTVGQAIALGGGITPRGSSNRIRLTRKLPDGTMRTADVKFDTPVAPDDLILVRTRIF